MDEESFGIIPQDVLAQRLQRPTRSGSLFICEQTGDLWIIMSSASRRPDGDSYETEIADLQPDCACLDSGG